MRGCLRNGAVAKRDFEKLLLEAVDEGLSWLGESSKRAIYFYLETSFNIKRREVPCRIEDFATAIEKIFGSGAKIIEIHIMKHLHEKAGQVSEWNQEQEDVVFTDYVAAARQSFLKKKKLELVQRERGKYARRTKQANQNNEKQLAKG